MTANTEYLVTVKTGETKNAGTDAYVSIQFIGDSSETTAVTLDHMFSNEFEKGQTDTFNVQMESLDNILMCKLHITDWGISSDWYIEYIKVSSGAKKYLFPIYEWVCDGYVCVANNFILKNDTATVLKKHRSEYLKEMEGLCRWATPEEQPYQLTGHLGYPEHSDLPRNLQWDANHNFQFKVTAVKTKLNDLAHKLLGKFNTYDVINGAAELIHTSTMSNRKVLAPCWDNWRTDREFARQQVNGSRPRGIKRVFEKLPQGFRVTDEDVHGLLPSGCTIQSEIEKGRMFIIDNTIMDGFPCGINPAFKVQLYTCSPYLLLYCVEEGYLMPLAIQLMANLPQTENPIWTPNDMEHDWLLAKCYFNNANGQLQQLTEHLLMVHLVTEPFGVALRRCIPKSHPVFSLLFPHFKRIISTNLFARTKLISPGGQVEVTMSLGGGGQLRIMEKILTCVSMDDYDFPEQLKTRGIDDPDMIKEYGFREDGLRYWPVINAYVCGILNIYYKTDEDVQNDFDINNWIAQVEKEGFANAGETKIPKKFESIDQLQLLLTKIIFASTIQHAGDGNGMFDIYGNVANQPFSMRQPPPNQKGVTMQMIKDSLPTDNMMATQMSTVFILSETPENEVFIGEFPMQLFTDQRALDVLEDFSYNVKRIGDEIRERNKSWFVPYEYLLPENVACRVDY